MNELSVTIVEAWSTSTADIDAMSVFPYTVAESIVAPSSVTARETLILALGSPVDPKDLGVRLSGVGVEMPTDLPEFAVNAGLLVDGPSKTEKLPFRIGAVDLASLQPLWSFELNGVEQVDLVAMPTRQSVAVVPTRVSDVEGRLYREINAEGETCSATLMPWVPMAACGDPCSGNLLFGTFSGAIVVFEPETGEFEQLLSARPREYDEGPGEAITSIDCSSDGQYARSALRAMGCRSSSACRATLGVSTFLKSKGRSISFGLWRIVPTSWQRIPRCLLIELRGIPTLPPWRS